MEAVIDHARVMAARGQRDWEVLHGRTLGARAIPVDPYDGVRLSVVLELGDKVVLVRPTGLAQDLCDAIFTWKVERGPNRYPAYLHGPATAVARYCDRNKIDHANASVVPEALRSGTHVWVDEGRRLVEARWLR